MARHMLLLLKTNVIGFIAAPQMEMTSFVKPVIRQLGCEDSHVKRFVIFASIFATQLNMSRACDYLDQLKLVTTATSSASKPLPAAQVAPDLPTVLAPG